MKKFVSIIAMCLVAAPAMALTPATGRGRASMSNQMMAAPRAVASQQQIQMAAQTVSATATVDKSSIKEEANPAVLPDTMISATKDMREKEKRACTQNNIGIGNTFVWASRYSNTNNYASMVEDVEEPENNTCFVKVELKSNDSKVSVSDVVPQYYEMGQNIVCGSWADEAKIEQRILDAKKSACTWATVGGAVGGAAIGVGAMELFGNKLIGGAVQGQKALDDDELLKSQLAVLKKDSPSDYNKFMKELKAIKTACENWKFDAEQKPEECAEYETVWHIAEK